MLPFSDDQFFAVFAAYNSAVWPMQWALTAVAVAAIILASSSLPGKDRSIGTLLAFLWAWMAIAYHWLHFASINPAAYGFSAAFLAQAGLLLWLAWRKDPVRFSFDKRPSSWVSAGLLVYALAVYPLLGRAFGHAYPAAPTFGVPCPTTIFTLGMLSIATGRHAALLVIVPALWAFVGASAAFLLDVPQDLALLLAAIVVVPRLLAHRPEQANDRAPPA